MEEAIHHKIKYQTLCIYIYHVENLIFKASSNSLKVTAVELSFLFPLLLANSNILSDLRFVDVFPLPPPHSTPRSFPS